MIIPQDLICSNFAKYFKVTLKYVIRLLKASYVDGPGTVTVFERKEEPAIFDDRRTKRNCDKETRRKMNEQVPSFGDVYAAYLELAENAPDVIEGQLKLNRALIDLIQPLAKLAKVEVKSITTDSTNGVYGQLKENRKALEKQQGRYLNAIRVICLFLLEKNLQLFYLENNLQFFYFEKNLQVFKVGKNSPIFLFGE